MTLRNVGHKQIFRDPGHTFHAQRVGSCRHAFLVSRVGAYRIRRQIMSRPAKLALGCEHGHAADLTITRSLRPGLAIASGHVAQCLFHERAAKRTIAAPKASACNNQRANCE